MSDKNIPIRMYETSSCNLDDSHELIDTDSLTWPAYDVFVFTGNDRKVIEDVPRRSVLNAIDLLREENLGAGVIGISKIGINHQDADMIATYGVGIH